MLLRPFTVLDGEATLDVFLRAIRITASSRYTPEQIAAWAPDDMDIVAWTAKRARTATVVATNGVQVVGFTDLDDRGYIDMLFVDPDFGRRGVASALLGWVLERADDRGLTELSTHASLVARPFFEKFGFVVLEQRYPVQGGVRLTNFIMHRALADPAI
ncbi:GNAT family N-acetyltransferase [Cryobacterium glaciale]|uniref:GNAT family N-acetyltransferase n=1 Tax=Cryobacterium glaciale TaxID=1259145 RepID=A0A4R8V6B4_9MICO|nr:GNAT family N-acetyltransferase [Cryobacterium glaciale]TFB76711.1 GNAT family N-acetyltransferase [Cryobacterium glaciale]